MPRSTTSSSSSSSSSSFSLARLLVLWCCSTLLCLVIPPSTAAATVAATQLQRPDLSFGDINVLVLTDTHSWVGGHSPNERPVLNADYGDVLSFYQRLVQYCTSTFATTPQSSPCRDLFFVVNGDWIDGTGLSLTETGETFGLTQILEKMPWDAVNIGNHELYRSDVIQYVRQPGGFIEWWGDRYLSSNIVLTDTRQPIGNRYRVLRNPATGTAVLTFGFLYNMKNCASVVTVEQVESVVQQSWFAKALHSQEFDAILVLAHMGARDPLVTVILDQIRAELGPDMPVQFITGHTHVRDYAVLDEYSTSFEAGRFLDTLGFVSFPKRSTVQAQAAAAANANKNKNKNNNNNGGMMRMRMSTNASSSSSSSSSNSSGMMTTTPSNSNNNNNNHTATTAAKQKLFQYNYLDANRELFRQTLHVDTLATPDGAALSKFIDRVQEELGLHQQVGCMDETYHLEYGVAEPHSLWGYFNTQLVPTQFPAVDQVVFLSKGALRYDMVSGRLRLDDVIAVSPFNESLYEWKGVTGQMILQLNATLNADHDEEWLPRLPNYILSKSIDNNHSNNNTTNNNNQTYDLITLVFEVEAVERAMAQIDPDAVIPDAVPRPETSTSIWIDHIQTHRPCPPSNDDETMPGHGNKPGRHHHKKNSTHGGSGSNTLAGGSYAAADPAKDASRLRFALLAAAVVVVLASINVWQRGRTYSRRQYAQHQRTLQAMRDYDDTGYRDSAEEYQDELSYSEEDDDDVIVDEEEGEFTIC